MKISIVIPAFNEEKLLPASLDSIHRATESFHRLGWETELIVCDNNSADRTAELARAAGAHVVFEPNQQISRARNTGAKAATGDWLVFVDADSRPSGELLADVATQIQSGRCLAGGSTTTTGEFHLIAGLVAYIWTWISRIAKWPSGAFIFCETSAFRHLGGFSLELWAAEEVELAQRLKRLAALRGQEIVILHRNPLLTSARKLHLYSLREQLRFTKSVLLDLRGTLRSRAACMKWYDGRR